MVPLANITKCLQAPFELSGRTVLELQLVEQFFVKLLCRLEVTPHQQVGIGLDVSPLGLQQRSEGELVALSAVAGPLNLQQQSQVYGITSRLGQLEAVLPLPGIEASGLSCRLGVFAVELGEPPGTGGNAVADRMGGRRGSIAVTLNPSFEVDLSFAEFNRGQSDVVVGLCHRGIGGQNGQCEQALSDH